MAPKPKATGAKGAAAAKGTGAAKKVASKATDKPAKKSGGVQKAVAAKKPDAAKKTAKQGANLKKPAAAKKPTKKAVAAKKTTKKDESPVEDSTTVEKPAAEKSGAEQDTATAETVKNVNGKRARSDDGDADVPAVEEESRPKKKARAAAAPKAPAVEEGPTGFHKKLMLKREKEPIVKNAVPSKVLDIFVFGEGSAGELGLGSLKYEGKKPIDVKRPRINHNLDAVKVGIVDIACGGMHTIALTKDNRVLTWGVNDDKALGRDTTWSGGVRDADNDDSDSDDDDDTGINPLESTPTQIENGELTEKDVICKVAACDSASFILTTDGFVYGWGTFRGADGIIGFNKDVKTQATPVLIEPLQDIVSITCGSNHVIALDVNGKVWTWGSGGQFQLGRKVISRHAGPTATLYPQPCGSFGKRHHAVSIAAGSYHSFYVDNHQRVWAWGLNNYAQTGHSDQTGTDDAMILQPKVVDALKDAKIVKISGGEHHTVACTEDGKLLTFGRVDGHQVGHPASVFNEENTVFDDNKRARILAQPTQVPDIEAKAIATGTDTSFVIDTKGRLFSWGFSANYQTGQGTTDDIEVPTLVDNTAIRGREMIWAGAGGQYSMVAAEHQIKESAAVDGN